ncbi:MAG: hypothetical protein ACKO2G_13600 [Verrucomicrobiales bacterium]
MNRFFPIRHAAAALLMFGQMAPAQDSLLTEKEQESMLKRLDSLEEEAGRLASGRLATAVTAFKAGLAGNEATIDLYLQCIEKVRYIDQNRPLIEFREWKRTQKDKFSEISFREALRYQLRWLLLGLEMASKELAPGEMGEKAAELVAAVIRDAKLLGPHTAMMKDSAFGTVFANAYRVGHLAPEGWPASPLPVGPVYEQLILPRLRMSGDIQRLETAWTTRINQETALMTTSAEADKEKGEADLDRFNTEERPRLLWKMLTDIYRAGGQRQSAGKMLSFLEANLSHRLAVEWASEMKGLLEVVGSPDYPPTEATTGSPPPAVKEETPEPPGSITPVPMAPPKPPPPAPAPSSDPFDAVNQPG